MARFGDEAQRTRKRATRVSLRTFQRVPKVVGETPDGEPIIEVGSNRLVFPHGGQYFHHLVKCSRCGRESLGDAVISSAHVGRPSAIFCDACTRSSIELAQPPQRQEEPPMPTEGTEPDEPSTPRPSTLPAEAVQEVQEGSAPPQLQVADLARLIRGAVASELAAGAERDGSRHEQEISAAFTTALDQARQGLETSLQQGLEAQARALSHRFEEAVRELATSMETALTGALEQQQRTSAAVDIAGLVAEELSKQRGPLLAEIRTVLVDGLQKVQVRDGTASEHIQEVVADSTTALGELLDQTTAALTSTVENRLRRQEEMVAKLGTALADRLDQRYQQLVSQVSTAIGAQLAEHRQAVAALAEGFQNAQSQTEHTQQVVADSTTALGERLDQTTAALTSTVENRLRRQEEMVAKLGTALADRLDQRYQQLVSQVSTALGDQLAEHRQAVEGALSDQLTQQREAQGAGLGGQLEQRFNQLVSQLAVALGDRLEEHRRALRKDVGSQLEKGDQAVLSELSTAVMLLSDHTTKAVTDLRRSLDDRVQRLDPEVLAQQVGSQTDALERLLAGQQELSERFEGLADRAGSSGTFSTALLQATGERVLGSVATLAAQIAELKGDMARTREGLVEVRDEVGGLRSAALHLGSGVPHLPLREVFTGLGVGSPPNVTGGEEKEAEAAPDEVPEEAAPVKPVARRTSKRTAGRKTAAGTTAAEASATSGTAKRARAKAVPTKKTPKGSPAKAAATETSVTAKRGPAKTTPRTTATRSPAKVATSRTTAKRTTTPSEPRRTGANRVAAPATTIPNRRASQRFATPAGAAADRQTARRTAIPDPEPTPVPARRLRTSAPSTRRLLPPDADAQEAGPEQIPRWPNPRPRLESFES